MLLEFRVICYAAITNQTPCLDLTARMIPKFLYEPVQVPVEGWQRLLSAGT
jgi:hypothetical protein